MMGMEPCDDMGTYYDESDAKIIEMLRAADIGFTARLWLAEES